MVDADHHMSGRKATFYYPLIYPLQLSKGHVIINR